MTVMPSTPTWWRASLTASSRDVWIIASTFVISIHLREAASCVSTKSGRDFPVVSLFAMLREVESLDLVIGGNAQPDRHVDDLQDHQRAHDRQDPRDRHTHQLVQQLMRIPLQ